MNKILISMAALSALTLASCAAGSGSTPRERFYRSLDARANPSAVIATELAFAREAREEGQWSAFREFATDDAVMFVPEAVSAQEWLSGRDDPPRSVDWQPHEVWSSCDGSLSVTKGAWQSPDGSAGYFTTVWERQGRFGDDDEEYRWVLDQGVPLTEPLDDPLVIQTTVADCAGGALPVAPASAPGATSGSASGSGSSRDRTLAYSWEVAPDLSRAITVTMLIDGEAEEVLAVAVPAPGGS